MDKRVEQRKPRVASNRSESDAHPNTNGDDTVMDDMEVGDLMEPFSQDHEDGVSKLD